MKKITIILLFLVFSTVIHAQEWHFGVTAGPTFSTAKISDVNYEDIEQPNYVIGFHIGGFAEFRLADKISLRPELLYTRLGYRYAPEEDEDANGWRLKSDYIVLPVMAEYAINEKLKADLGPYISVKLSAKGRVIPSSEADIEDYQEGYFDYFVLDEGEYNTLDVGLGVGLGYQIQPKFGVNLRYNHGLANIWDHLFLYRQPFALQAALQIGHFVSHDLYAEQQAQEQVFKQIAPAYRVLHFGTHAEVNNQSPLQSRIFFAKALANDTLNTDDGYLHAYEIYSMQLRAELAVLTACETGVGAWHNGEGVISLAHSFMHAGCSSVVMSLWKIDEKASMDIITKFYKYLARGNDKSTALRKAKLQWIASGGERLSHPYYWAGLALMGDSSPLYSSYRQFYWGGGLLVVLVGIWLVWRRRLIR